MITTCFMGVAVVIEDPGAAWAGGIAINAAAMNETSCLGAVIASIFMDTLTPLFLSTVVMNYGPAVHTGPDLVKSLARRRVRAGPECPRLAPRPGFADRAPAPSESSRQPALSRREC